MNLRPFILSFGLLFFVSCKRAPHSHGKTTILVNIDTCNVDEIYLITPEGHVSRESPQTCERSVPDHCELESRALPSRIDIDIPDTPEQIQRCRSAIRATRDREALPVELHTDYASTTFRSPRLFGGSTSMRRLHYYLHASP